MIFTKTRNELEQFGLQNTKIYGGKIYSRSAPLARKYTNRIFESEDGATSMKYYIRLEDKTFV